MPKMKVNMGTPAAPNWVVMDAKDALTLQGKSAADFTLVGHGHQAKDVSIADAGNVITASDVEGALQESFKQIGNLTTLTTTAKGDLVSAIKEVKAGNDYATNAGKVNNIQFRMNGVNLEFNDGTGWKLMGGGIKSIQKGVATLSNGTVTSINVTISSVDPTKSIIVPSGSSSLSDYSQDSNVRIELVNSTTLTFTRGRPGGSGSTVVGWQVIEYV